MTRPLVSVVITTYNRSAVMATAVRSVLASSVRDLEVIVVGDACTDDSEHVVAAVGDPRVRFLNLPTRTGDQAEPTNVGIAQARGEFIALLNHDDLYLPHHLEWGISQLNERQADFFWSSTLVVTTVEGGIRFAGRWAVAVASTPIGGVTYDPYVGCKASSWVFRNGVAERVGRWRQSDSLYVFPSQDWLFRAWRSGARMAFGARPGVVVPDESDHKYQETHAEQHEALLKALAPRAELLEDLLVVAAVGGAASARSLRWRAKLLRWCAAKADPFLQWLMRRGIHPKTPHAIVRYGTRGGANRRRRTLVPPPERAR